MRKLLLGILFLLSVSVIAGAEAETADSRYRLKTGETFRYRLTAVTETISDTGSASHRLEEWRVGYGFKVLGGSNPTDGTLIRGTLETIVYKTDSLFQQYECIVNPGDPALPVSLRPYAQLIGSEFLIKISNRSKLVSVSGQDSAAMDLNQMITRLMSGTMGVRYSLPQLTRNIFLPYPGKGNPLRTGDSWVAKVAFSNGMLAPETKVEYRVAGFTDAGFVLEVRPRSQCVYKQKLSVRDNPTLLAETSINLTGTLTGQFEVDQATLLPRTGNIAIELSGTVKKFDVTTPTTVKITVSYQSTMDN
jgi:hypothetical protein